MVMAEKLSKRLGNTSIFTPSASSNIYLDNQSMSFSETVTPLISPVQLFALPKDNQLLIFAGKEKAVFGIKLPYYDDDACKDKASDNPYFRG